MRSDWRKIQIILGIVAVLTLLSCRGWNRWFNYPTLSRTDKTKLVEMIFETILESENNFLYEVFPDSVIYVWGYGLEQEHIPNIPGINLVHLNTINLEEKVAELGSLRCIVLYFFPDYDETRVDLRLETRYPDAIQRWVYYGKHKVNILKFLFHKEAKTWILDDVKFEEGEIIYQ